MVMNTYYEENLYPLQDKILSLIEEQETDFYLSGGTALSRCYFNHRYSDDLDLFVNQHKRYQNFSETVLETVRNEFGLEITNKSENFYSFLVEDTLKVDLINDVAAHIGEFKKCEIFSKTDNVNNILSNKISSIASREEPKDVVDIWIICKNREINWKKIFTDVSSKAVGIFPPNVAKKLDTFPVTLLDDIRWIDAPPKNEEFEKDLKQITEELLSG